MKTLTPFLVLGSLLALTACPDGTIDPTDSDTDVTVDCAADDVFPTSGPLSAGDYDNCNIYTGDTKISYFPAPACSGSWSMGIETRGWGSGATVYMHDSAGGNATQSNWWGEEHDMAQGASNPDSWWDAYALTLPIVNDFNNQVDSTNSFLKCATNDGATLVWGVELFEFEGTAVEDCVIISESETTDGFVDEFKTSFPNMAGCDQLDGWTAE